MKDYIRIIPSTQHHPESCELVGSFLLHNITQKYGKNFGLYRDDGLGIIKGSPRQVELTKKDLCAIFNECTA